MEKTIVGQGKLVVRGHQIIRSHPLKMYTKFHDKLAGS